MKIAFALEGNSINSDFSDFFGRCHYIIILNHEEKLPEVIKNPFCSSIGGAGIHVSQLLVENNCDVLITKNIGNQALLFLESVGIKVYLSPEENAATALILFNEGRLESVKSQNMTLSKTRRRYKRRGN